MNITIHSTSRKVGRIVLCLLGAAAGAVVLTASTCSVLNKAPTVPVISGPSAGVVGVPVTFKATATDPEGDSIAFQFDWGDATTLAWSAFIGSGETLSLAHTYTDSGTFSVRARARDVRGGESDSSSATVLRLAGAARDYPDSIVTRIPTHTGAFNIAVSGDGRYLYVTHRGYDLLSVVDVESRSVLRTITVGRDANDVALSPDGMYAMVTAHEDSSLTIVRTADGQLLAKINVGEGPQQVAADPSGTRAFVPASSPGWLAVVSVPAGVFTDTVHVGGAPVGAVVDAIHNRLYVSDATGRRILVFELPNLGQVSEIALDSRPYKLVLGSNGMLYARTAGDTGVVAVRTSDEAVVGYLQVNRQLQDIIVAPSGEYLYVTHSRGTYYVHAPTMSIVDSLSIDEDPTVQGVAVEQAGSEFIVANYDEVVVIGGRTQ